MQETPNSKHLSDEEIKDAVLNARKSGMRYTVDLYLLDYIKHCFLEDDQLNNNIEKLRSALPHLADENVKTGVNDVLKCLECVKTEYTEYLEDVNALSEGNYPKVRGMG